MAELFGIDKSGIRRHLAKIFETDELDEEVVVAKIATTTQHRAMQDKTETIPTNYYNLDAIFFCRLQSKLHSGNQVPYMGNLKE